MQIESFVRKREDHEFSDDSFNSPDFLKFAREYKNIVTAISEELGAILLMQKPGHYELSRFLEKEGKFAYGSINDVRGSDNRKDKILVRTAKHEKDYTGGHNQYTTIQNLQERLAILLR